MRRGRMDPMRYVALLDGKAGAYGVVVPDLPGCTSAGKTADAAYRNTIEAVRLWIEDAREAGKKIPRPRAPEELRADRKVRHALAAGAILMWIPVVRDTGRPAKGRRLTKTPLRMDSRARPSLPVRRWRRSAAGAENNCCRSSRPPQEPVKQCCNVCGGRFDLEAGFAKCRVAGRVFDISNTRHRPTCLLGEQTDRWIGKARDTVRRPVRRLV